MEFEFITIDTPYRSYLLQHSLCCMNKGMCDIVFIGNIFNMYKLNLLILVNVSAD